LSLRDPDDKSSGPPQQHPSSIIGGNSTVISLINMLMIKVDNFKNKSLSTASQGFFADFTLSRAENISLSRPA